MRISTLAELTDETTRTLRFYEDKGLLPPPARTPRGYRDYDGRAVEQVRFIRDLQRAGLTLDHIADIVRIRDRAQPGHSADVAQVESALLQVDQQLTNLTSMRTQFSKLARTAATKTGTGELAGTGRTPSQSPAAKDR